MARASPFVIASLVAGLAFAGCGGNTVSATSYVHTVCGAATRWMTAIKTEETSLSSNLSSITSPQAGKQALTRFIGGIENDTTSMIDSIKAAGTPNATNGSAISSQLVDDLTKFRDSIDKIHTQAGSISTASPQAFQADAQNLLKGFQSTSNLISSFGSDPFAKSAQLEQAFNRDPACEKMR